MHTHTRSGRPSRWLGALSAVALILSGTALLTEVTASAAPLNRCVSDDSGLPVVQQVVVSPSSVDVTEASQQVTLSMEVADTGGPGEASGVDVVRASFDRFGGSLRLEKGEGNWWSATFTVPRYAPDGVWRLSNGLVKDAAGNSIPNEELLTAMDSGEPPFDQATLDVTSSPDRLPPTVTGVEITPDRVNTERRAKLVGFTLTATDAESGVDRVTVLAQRGRYAESVELAREGDIFSGRMRIPTWRGTGTWNVQVLADDRIGNRSTYKKSALEAVGESSFEVVSRKDAAQPAFRSIALDPARVDIRQRAKTVRFTVRAADRRSGVSAVRVGLLRAGPVEDDPDENVIYAQLERTGGTAKRGTWTGKIRLVPCTFIHSRTRVYVDVQDRAQNEEPEIPTVLRVRALDLFTPKATIERSIVGASGPITVSFNEPVNGINADSPSVRTSGGTLAGSWRCFTGSGERTSCATGRVREASWTPDAPLATPGSYAIELNPEGNLDVTDLNGNPFRRVVCSASTQIEVPAKQEPRRCHQLNDEY